MRILEVPIGGIRKATVSFSLSTRLIVEIYHLIIYKSKGRVHGLGIISNWGLKPV